ncbi:type II secretion system protein [Vibrio fluvialis]|uniref:type II secretion system protein n=1 Tax=Vibrio fluvialis TaxID=676 RepID=UPI00192BCB35|nr:type II secretion system protein [Vibrio fluvialis]MBL4262809.1 type II secretion system protein [Vibrio fluvialis]
MNMKMNKQRGFVAIISMLMFTSFIALLVAYIIPSIDRYKETVKAEKLVTQIGFIWEAVKEYQADRYNAGVDFYDIASLPESIDDLMPGYIQECSVEDNEAGGCLRPDMTPWGEYVEYEREVVQIDVAGTLVSVPGSVIRVSFKAEPSEFLRNMYRAVLSQLPNGKYDETEKVLEFRFGRIGSEVEHQAFLRNDGTTPLVSDSWDVGGNTWITNVKGLFLRNQDGSQQSVAGGLQRSVLAKSGQSFDIQSCPAGHEADLDVSVVSIQPFSASNRFTSLGAFTGRKEIKSGKWYVYLEYYAKRESDSQWVKMSDGYLRVTFKCNVS